MYKKRGNFEYSSNSRTVKAQEEVRLQLSLRRCSITKSTNIISVCGYRTTKKTTEILASYRQSTLRLPVDRVSETTAGKRVQTGDIWGLMVMSGTELGCKRLAT